MLRAMQVLQLLVRYSATSEAHLSVPGLPGLRQSSVQELLCSLSTTSCLEATLPRVKSRLQMQPPTV